MQSSLEDNKNQNGLLSIINKLFVVIVVMLLGFIAIPFVYYFSSQPGKPAGEVVPVNETIAPIVKKDLTNYWIAQDINSITDTKQKELVAYGKELVVHTAKYLGPNGSVQKISNGLNCQNCHLQAGTAIFGNNYGSVASLYPKFRPRSGTIETIFKRVNDCFERSLNGKSLDTSSKEMQAIVAYINFVGSNVAKGTNASGSGFKDLAFLDRAADPVKGQSVYTSKCQSCHQPDGAGVFNTDKTEFTFPALWGNNSYTDAAGLYRISSFAKYVKHNMPQGVTFINPQLTDEEAWDVAAFVCTQPRPHRNEPEDWPDKFLKPIDHPFGPYADSFLEKQHKLGPFKPIIEAKNKIEQAKQKVSFPAKNKPSV